MPIVITAKELIKHKAKFSIQGFFIDTNIVILTKDPFSESSISPNTYKFESVQIAIELLKSKGFIPYSTLPVILEYYKHIQFNTYTLYLQKEKYNARDFKNRKHNDLEFKELWENRMKQFKKTFKKTFPLFEVNESYQNLLDEFNFVDLDFGDHLLINIVSKVKQSLKIIFSNDIDFYSLSDDYFLITTNKNILNKAKAERKLFSQKF